MDQPEQKLENQAVEPEAATKRPKKKKSTAVWVIVTVLLLVVLGVMSYLLATAYADMQDKQDKLSASQEKVAELERKVSKANQENDKTTEIETDTSNPDSEAIVKAAVAYQRAQVGAEGKTFKVSVDKLELPFARANVGAEEGGGAACFFKKVDDIWLPLYCAQGESQETNQLMSRFGVPVSLVES